MRRPRGLENSGDGGSLHSRLASRGIDFAGDEPMEVSEGPDISGELYEFIDRLIVPLLVDLFNKGHLYSAEAPRYDEDAPGLAEAA